MRMLRLRSRGEKLSPYRNLTLTKPAGFPFSPKPVGLVTYIASLADGEKSTTQFEPYFISFGRFSEAANPDQFPMGATVFAQRLAFGKLGIRRKV